MEDSRKGASSTSDAKKKSSSIDDEIGKDFLTSWKLTTDGKDEMDFTSETPSRVRKTKFDFGKLDDFEFGDDVGKMPSFKMDMSDLDFSSPQRKTEKSKERLGNDSVHEMKNGKQRVFSFNFDFNELEGFGLDSNLLKDEKKSDNDIDNKKFDCCGKNDINPDTKSNLANNISGIEKVLKDMGKSDEATSSNSGYMMPHRDADVANHSTPTAVNNKCSAELFASDKHITVAHENIIEGKKSEGHKEQLDISAYKNLNTEKVPQVLSVQSTDMMALETPSVLQIEDDVMDLCDRKSDMEQVKSRDFLNSPDSRSSCSANALNLTYLSKDWNSNAFDFGSHGQSDASKGSLSDKKADQVMNVGNTAVPTVSSKPACQTKNEDKYSSSPKNLLTSLRREPNSGAQQALQKVCFLKPLNGEVKQTGQALQKVCASKHLSGEVTKQTEQACQKALQKVFFLKPLNGEVKQTGQALQKVCVSKPLSGEVTKQTKQACLKVISSKPLIAEAANQRLAVLEDDRYKKSSPKQTTHRSPLNSMLKLGGLAYLRPPKVSSVEKPGLCSVTNDAKCEISRPSSKINLPISTNQKKSNLISICDMSMETNTRKSPKLASTGIAEKHAMLSPSLKRKSFEESIADSASLKSFKRSSESPTGKSNIVDVSPTINRQSVLNPENIEVCSNDASPGLQTSSFDIPLVTSKMVVDVPLLLEDDGNVQKAEACAKELEGICNMLKKKHEDAKELLVRAVVNNNLLLMLNHPILEEKISFNTSAIFRSLQAAWCPRIMNFDLGSYVADVITKASDVHARRIAVDLYENMELEKQTNSCSHYDSIRLHETQYILLWWVMMVLIN